MPKTAKKEILAALAAMALLSSASFAQPTEKPGHIGVLLPLSGPLAPFGQKALRGILAGSGLLEKSPRKGLVLHIADTCGDAKTAAAEAKKLASEGVTAIIGPLKGDEVKSAGEVANSLSLPLLALTPARESTGGSVFRIFMREEEEVDALVGYAVEKLGFRRLAVLFPDTPAGRNYRALFWESATRRGAAVTASETFPPNAESLEEPLKRATGVFGISLAEQNASLERERQRKLALLTGPREEEPAPPPPEKPSAKKKKNAPEEPVPQVDFQALFLPVTQSLKAAQLAPQLPYYDITGVRLMGLRSWNYPDLVNVGKEYVEGALIPSEWSPSTAAGALFEDKFTRGYEEKPGALETYGFDAVSLVISKGALAGRKELLSSLASLREQEAVTGPLSTAPSGEIPAIPSIMMVQRGEILPASEGPQ